MKIETLSKKSLPQLKALAQLAFNAYIRERDKNLPCISCGQMKPLQAGHFYPVKTYDGLRYDEDNCHGECQYDNCFNDFHLVPYEKNLIKRIGEQRYKELEQRADNYKKNGYKWSKSELIDIIKKYQQKIKEL
jgi:hypothetical protein